MKISLLLNSREKDRKNCGNIFEWTNSVRNSVFSVNNIEVVIKYDNDDDSSVSVIESLKAKNSDMMIKTFHSERVGYGGQHIGYSQCFNYIDKSSVVVYPMPDDTFFIPGNNWDLPIFKHVNLYPDGIFLIKMAPLHQFTDIILFSRKLIEMIGFGPKFAVDQWGFSLCKIFTELGIQDRILCSPETARRRGCKLDYVGVCPEGDERWYGPRQDMLDFMVTQEYTTILNDVRQKLTSYLKL